MPSRAVLMLSPLRLSGGRLRFRITTVALLSLLTRSASAQRSDCGPTQHPKQLPAPSGLIDSSNALSELTAFHALRDSMRFTLVFPEGDSVPLIHPLETADTLAAAVLARATWPQKPGELWAIQVRVRGGSAPALTVHRSTYCPPAVKEDANQPFRTGVGELRYQSRDGIQRPGLPPGTHVPPRTLHAVFEVVVTDTGAVRYVKMISGSGVEAYDHQYGIYVGQLKFDPALIDGLPVEAIYRTDKKSPRI
jgi:hypothetical protein